MLVHLAAVVHFFFFLISVSMGYFAAVSTVTKQAIIIILHEANAYDTRGLMATGLERGGGGDVGKVGDMMTI